MRKPEFDKTINEKLPLPEPKHSLSAYSRSIKSVSCYCANGECSFRVRINMDTGELNKQLTPCEYV